MASKDNEIEYSYLYIGMRGYQMTNAINNNFRNTSTKFSDIEDELDIRIISNTIKYIKSEDEIISYSEDNENWHSINVWGAIKGNINDQTDLKNALGDKVSISAFNTLNSKVSKNTNDIIDLSNNSTALSNKVTSLDNAINNSSSGILVRLDNIDTELDSKVSSQQIKAIRCTDDTNVYFTIDGTTWKPITNIDIKWGDITGNISDQTDLNNLINSIQNSIQTISSSLNTLNNNLSEVENRLNKMNPLVYMTETDYRALSSIDENTIYIVSPN